MLRGPVDDVVAEKRQVAPMPPLWPASLSAYLAWPGEFENYFRDCFGFRTALLKFAHQTSAALRLENPRSVGVLRGKEDWLFYSPVDEVNPIDIHAGRLVFGPAEIEKIVGRLVAWERWLGARGTAFFLMVPPDKISVYPQYAPTGLTFSPRPETTNELLRSLQAAGLRMIDPLARLQERGKVDPTLYHHRDTHWPKKGALIGYAPLGDALAARYPTRAAVAESEVSVIRDVPADGDLELMLGATDADPELVYRLDWTGQSGLAGNTALPRAIIFHDSFMTDLRDILQVHFSEDEFHGTPKLSATAIERFNPDVVILEIVERNLYLTLSQEPPPGH